MQLDGSSPGISVRGEDRSNEGRASYDNEAFATDYARFRPKPPDALLDLLIQFAAARPPGLVVDLGSGTGATTVPWATRARRVVGIESNPSMLRAAPQVTGVEYALATADQTGLDDECADIVTCGQSFHWMPLRGTLREVERILKPGGLFAAFDYDIVPAITWDIDAAITRVLALVGINPLRPEKQATLDRIGAGASFGQRREALLHARTELEAEWLIGYVRTLGAVARRLEAGDGELDDALSELRETITRGSGSVTLWAFWGYRVRLASKRREAGRES